METSNSLLDADIIREQKPVWAFSRKVFCEGIRDGVPIALGYFAVSFSLGIAARKAGFTPFQGFLASLLNNASAGEYAAFALIMSGASYFQVAVITLIANARYLLMSCALAQRFAPGTPFWHRLVIGYDVTDELFGITIARPGSLNPCYTYGAILLAAPAWASGTALGIVAGNLLPLLFSQARGALNKEDGTDADPIINNLVLKLAQAAASDNNKEAIDDLTDSLVDDALDLAMDEIMKDEKYAKLLKTKLGAETMDEVRKEIRRQLVEDTSFMDTVRKQVEKAASDASTGVSAGWDDQKVLDRMQANLLPISDMVSSKITELGNGAGTIVDKKVDDTVHKFLPGKLGDWVSDKVGNKVNNIVQNKVNDLGGQVTDMVTSFIKQFTCGKQLGGQDPEQHQQKQADEAQKEHQLPADAKPAPGIVCSPHELHSLRLPHCVGVELVADAPHGGDIAAALAQMAAQHLDVGVHGAVLAEVVVVPYLLQDLFAAEGDALVGGQEHQQVELLGGQGHILPGHPHGVAGGVDGQVPEGHGGGRSFRPGHGAVEHGTHAGHQLPGGEGLDHIVVGTALQAGQLIVFLAAGGEDDHGGVDVAVAHLTQAGHTVHKGHHQVQNHQIIPAAGQQRQSGGAVTGFFTGVAGIL